MTVGIIIIIIIIINKNSNKERGTAWNIKYVNTIGFGFTSKRFGVRNAGIDEWFTDQLQCTSPSRRVINM